MAMIIGLLREVNKGEGQTSMVLKIV